MDHTNFLGGLWITPTFDAAVPENAVIRADDVEFLATKSIRGRRGRVLFSGLNQYPIIGLHRHYPRSGTARFLAAFDTTIASVIRHDAATPGVFTAITGGTGHQTGFHFHFASWPTKDKTFLANGLALLAYDGTTILAVDQTGTQMTGPYLTIHQSRLFATVLSEIQYSVYATAILDEFSSPGIQLNVSDVQGGSINGLGTLPSRLIITKDTSLWSMVGDVEFSPILTKFSDYGVTAPLSLQFDGTGFFYVGRAGVYWSDGESREPLEISQPIRELFVTTGSTNQYPHAVGVWYPRKQMYVVKLDPAHAYTYRVQRLRLSRTNGTSGLLYVWSKNTAEPLVAGAVCDSEIDTGDYFVSDNAGNLFRCDVGATDYGALYTPSIQLPASRLGPQQQEGRVHYVFLNYRGSEAATVGLRYDNHQSDDLTLTSGQQHILGIQTTKTKIHDQTHFGHFVSAVVSLPAADGPEAELYSVRLDPRLRAARVWR